MTNTDDWIASSEAETFDIILAEYDCWGTQAHVLMLQQQGIMSEADAQAALGALAEIEQICIAGKFRYEPGYGAQLTLEKMIVDRVGGAIGYQVHTGRSRNDQVLTAQRLCVRSQMIDVLTLLQSLIASLLRRSAVDERVIMPGYTHMQPARPTTVGQWTAAYADMFIRDFRRLQDIYARVNTNPLGAAESHGTTWDLDRDYTRELLGFTAIDEIPLDAISSRGESDAEFLTGLSFVALHLSKFAQDLLLFNTFEYGYAALGSGQATRMGKLTGSSIMPQKRNPDVLELLRAQASEIYSYLFHALDVLKSLPTGYNRDSRDTKAPILRSIGSILGSLQQAVGVVETVEFNEAAMLDAVIKNYCMATDLAEYLAQRHDIPYRKMHGIVGRSVATAIDEGRTVAQITPEQLAAEAHADGYEMIVSEEDIRTATDPAAALERRDNIGGASKKRMNTWQQSRQQTLSELMRWIEQTQQSINTTRNRVRNNLS